MQDINTEPNNIYAPNAKVLLIDDSKVTRTIERDLIKNYCSNVTTASSGIEAIKLLNSDNSYDIIFIDYMMPNMDGSETAFRIKNMPQLKNSILIMLTASKKESLDPYIMKEFNDFLEKPINSQNLKEILKKYLPKKLINKPESKIDNHLTYKNNDIRFDGLFLRDIDINKAIENCGGNIDSYNSLLSVVYYDGKNKLEILKNLIKVNDIKNYTIEVHALKTVAALVGDFKLSEMAKLHEDAGNSFDYIFIDNNFNSLYDEYKSLLECIKPIINNENPFPLITQTKEFDISEVLDLMRELDDGIDNFDLDISYELINKLLHYKLKSSYISTLKSIQNYLNIFDYDNSQRLVKNLIDALSCTNAL